MLKNTMNLQDQYLNTIRKDHIKVSIYLVNGIKLSGMVSSFDQYIVILRDGESTINQLIYKHAISTIVPSKAVYLHNPELEEEVAVAEKI